MEPTCLVLGKSVGEKDSSGSFRVKWSSGRADTVSDLAHSVTFDLFP